MLDIDPAGNSIWFSAIPACSGVQLDWDLLLHVLHINGVRHCVFSPSPQVLPLPAPWPTAAPVPSQSQQWHWLPSFAALAQDIGSVGWILCWHQYTNKKLVVISNLLVSAGSFAGINIPKKTRGDIKLAGHMHMVLGSIPELCNFISHLKANGYERIYKGIKGYWKGVWRRVEGVGQCMVGWPWIFITDMYYGYNRT